MIEIEVMYSRPLTVVTLSIKFLHTIINLQENSARAIQLPNLNDCIKKTKITCLVCSEYKRSSCPVVVNPNKHFSTITIDITGFCGSPLSPKPSWTKAQVFYSLLSSNMSFFYSVVGCLYKFGAIAARESRPNGAAYVSPVCRNHASIQDLAAAAASCVEYQTLNTSLSDICCRFFSLQAWSLALWGTGNSLWDFEKIGEIFFSSFY